MPIRKQLEVLIDTLNLKKVEFARTLKIDQSYVTKLISGDNNPSDRLVDDICDKYNVNKNWLLTGKGPIFIELDREDEIISWAGALVKPSNTDDKEFIKDFVHMLTKLDSDDWKTLEKMAKLMCESHKKS